MSTGVSSGAARAEDLNDPSPSARDALVAAIGSRFPGADSSRRTATVPPSVDWDALLRSADRHRVTPLIARHVERWGPSAPPGARAELQKSARAAAADSLQALDALRTLFDALEHAGIAALAWKGPALAIQAWDDPAARLFSDLDVVVDRRDRDRARSLLHELGWQSRWPMSVAQERAIFETQGAWELTREASPALLELHWAFSARRFAGRLPVTDVIARATCVQAGSVALPVPCPADTLVLLAQHGTKHGWSTLEDVAVFAAMLARLPGEHDAAFARARGVGGARAFRLGCALAEGTFGIALSGQLGDAIADDDALPVLAAEVRARWDRDEGAWRSTLAWDLATTHRAADRARLLLRSLVDPTLQEWHAVQLPDALLPLYRVVRPLRLAGRALGIRR